MRILAWSLSLAWLLPQSYLFSLELLRARVRRPSSVLSVYAMRLKR
jgi:hypothetical protein